VSSPFDGAPTPDYAIDVERLGVRYNLRLTRQTTVRTSFKNLLKRHEGPTHFWALRDVSFRVVPGESLAIIGPNGAGKTSIFNCISGIYAPSQGHIRFDGRDITALKPYQRAHLGIARTFQNIALFKGMSVLDNIKIGRHIHLRAGVLASGVYYGKAAREERTHRAVIEREIIDLLELQDIRHKIVGTLP
jgi:branched-chain amino acid transport system ATP-binding protein